MSDRYNIIVAEIRGGEQLRFDREFTVVMITYGTKNSEEGSCHKRQVDAELIEPHLLRESRHDDRGKLTLKTFRNLILEQLKSRIVHARVTAELAQNGTEVVALTVNEAEK